MIIILRRSQNYDNWFPSDDYTKRTKLETLLKEYIDKEGYKLIGMNELIIILFKSDNPSRR